MVTRTKLHNVLLTLTTALTLDTQRSQTFDTIVISTAVTATKQSAYFSHALPTLLSTPGAARELSVG